MNILVTGASGAIGPRVVHALGQKGYQIRTFSVDVSASSMFPPHVEIIIGDVTDQVAVQSAMQDMDAVVHMAGFLHIDAPPPDLQEKYERINVGGTSTVVAEAIRAGVKRVVFFSTIAVYGPSNGRILTEDAIPHPDTFYARTKLAAERIVFEAKNSDGTQIGSVLRLGAVYGSRIKGNYERLVHSLAKGRFIPVGNGSNRRTLVYDKDVARAAVLALEHPNATGKIFNVSDGRYHTLDKIVRTICQALGRKTPRLSLPLSPVKFGVWIVGGMARLVGQQAPIQRAMLDKYTEDVAVDSRFIQRELGFTPQYDLERGWEETIREMRNAREL